MTYHEKQSDATRWIVHGERSIYESEWVRLSLVDVELPDGQRFDHHVVRMPAAAMSVVLDEQDRVLLMWRHRFVSDIWNWELPGGIVEEGEEPAQTAVREIEEETGYRAHSVEHLVTFQPQIGMLDCPHYVFLARRGECVGEPVEKTEMQRMEWVPLEEVPRLIKRGEIANSGTLVALLHVLAMGHVAAVSHGE